MKAENSKVVIIALAANVGIVLAAIGLLLEGGSTLAAFREFDSIASILIGVLLGCVAIFLAREAKGLLIGESADPAHVDIVVKGIAGLGHEEQRGPADTRQARRRRRTRCGDRHDRTPAAAVRSRNRRHRGRGGRLDSAAQPG